MEITPLSDFQIAETQTFQKAKTKLDDKLYKKITNIAYPQLRINPLSLILATEPSV
jgi:hypothetical protein